MRWQVLCLLFNRRWKRRFNLQRPIRPSEDYSTAVRNNFWDNAHTSDLSSRGERLGREPNALVQHAQCTGGS
jgi:hypothetical protein